MKNHEPLEVTNLFNSEEGDFIREDKYLVLKWDDIEKHTNDEQKRWIDRVCYSIRSRRLAEGKKDNSYVVVNEDEPYAEKVWNLIQEQWEKDNI